MEVIYVDSDEEIMVDAGETAIVLTSDEVEQLKRFIVRGLRNAGSPHGFVDGLTGVALARELGKALSALSDS